jgi:uncharacterized protein YneF (UPF0154 family)
MPIIGPLVGIFVLFPLLVFILSKIKLERTSEIMVVIIGAVGLALGGYLAGKMIYSAIAKKHPILKDIPAFMSGQYGVEVGELKIESARPEAPIFYYLKLAMSDERIARRFIEYFQGVKIFKGQNIV